MPSNIEWTDETWNPLTGCTLVSAGCTNCYAAQLAATRLKDTPRYKGLAIVNSRGVGVFTGKVLLHEDLLTKPLKWRKPRMVFVNSMSDLFHPDVPFEFIDKVFAVMALCPQHTFQVLTKRPDRMAEYLSRQGLGLDVAIQDASRHCFNRDLACAIPMPNLWLGTSVEDQVTADERIPHLLKCPAAVRFLSCEPLLGPVKLTTCVRPYELNCHTGRGLDCPIHCFATCEGENGIHWVICGGESGPNARPMHPDWARSLRDQCAEAGVPFFFKQWGEWAPDCRCGRHEPCKTIERTGFPIGCMFRCGKKRAGRLLDGVTHDGFPETA